MKFVTGKNKGLGFWSLIGAAFLYGWYGIFSKLIAFDLPLFYASSIRSLIPILIILVFLFFARKQHFKTVAAGDYKWIALRSLLGLVADLALIITFINIEIGTGYFIFYGVSTVAGYMLGKAMFGEKIDVIRGVALGLSILGLYLIYRINLTPNSGLYILLASLSGIGTAGWNIIAKKMADKYPTLQLNFLDFLICFFATVIFSLFRGETWVIPQLSAVWMYNVLFALMYLVTGQLVIVGFKHLDAQIGSLVMLMEILFGIILGFIFFQETLTMFTLLGGLLIITAVVLPELNFKPSFWQKIFRR